MVTVGITIRVISIWIITPVDAEFRQRYALWSDLSQNASEMTVLEVPTFSTGFGQLGILN